MTSFCKWSLELSQGYYYIANEKKHIPRGSEWKRGICEAASQVGGGPRFRKHGVPPHRKTVFLEAQTKQFTCTVSIVFPPLWLVIKVISQPGSHQWIFIRHSTVTSDFTCIHFHMIFFLIWTKENLWDVCGCALGRIMSKHVGSSVFANTINQWKSWSWGTREATTEICWTPRDTAPFFFTQGRTGHRCHGRALSQSQQKNLEFPFTPAVNVPSQLQFIIHFTACGITQDCRIKSFHSNWVRESPKRRLCCFSPHPSHHFNWDAANKWNMWCQVK